MPIVTFHLINEQLDSGKSEQLLVEAARLYAEVLESPLDRVRAFINSYPMSHSLVAGKVIQTAEQGAPFFEFIIMAGRPESQVRDLMNGFTQLLADQLEVERACVRGRCIRVDPLDWGIAGRVAADIRADEIAKRNSEREGD